MSRADAIVRLNEALEGRYRIERELDEGGMAAVYLADDLKHERRVALKVLRPELAAVVGAERFLGEIKTTANLQHPHILPLHDSGEADGFLFYVMPYVEGESLRDRLDREHQLPVDEAAQIATNVAEALDYAHRKGVIHRDIKPANILLLDGKPVVSDFGIALAVSVGGKNRLTETGLSLGTPHYMSPEQATGDAHVGPATDVYALGCVLYEMLVGEPPYTGSTPQAILGKIITEPPAQVTKQRKAVPANVEATIAKALEKVPADRFTSARDFAAALANPAFRAPGVAAAGPGGRRPASPSGRWNLLSGSLAAAAVLLALLAGWALTRPSGPPPPTVLRGIRIALPDSAPLTFRGVAALGVSQSSLALSRDGSLLAYAAPEGESTVLFLRRMGTGDTRRLDSTEGAYSPFFSPEGDWVGFFVGATLRKVRVEGGASSLVAERGGLGGVWLADGRIVVTGEGAPDLVGEAGGAVDPLPPPMAGGRAPGYPPFIQPSPLPGGEWVVGSLMWTGQLAVLSLADGEILGITRRGLLPVDSIVEDDILVGLDPTFVPPGHLVYLSGDGALVALPFDGRTREVRGDPVRVESGVRSEETLGFGHFAVGDNGLLVYAPGVAANRGYLAWIDGTGAADTLPFPRDNYNGLRLSDDGRRLAVDIPSESGRGRSVHVLDLETGRREELRAPPGQRPFGVAWDWSPDGTAIVAERYEPGRWMPGDIYVRTLRDGSERPVPALGGGWTAFHPDGTVLVDWDSAGIAAVALDGGEVRHFSEEVGGQFAFSPDGHWLAFFGGDRTLRVAPFPSEGRSFPITEPGLWEQPVWDPDGTGIYYKGSREIWRMSFSPSGGPDGGPRIGTPRLFARGPFVRVFNWSYDIAPDGRILVVMGPPEQSVPYLEVVTGFPAELERLAPARR